MGKPSAGSWLVLGETDTLKMKITEKSEGKKTLQMFILSIIVSSKEEGKQKLIICHALYNYYSFLSIVWSCFETLLRTEKGGNSPRHSIHALKANTCNRIHVVVVRVEPVVFVFIVNGRHCVTVLHHVPNNRQFVWLNEMSQLNRDLNHLLGITHIILQELSQSK